MIRNEEFFIERVLKNIEGICDEIIVLEHKSEDDTLEIVQRFAKDNPKIRIVRIESPVDAIGTPVIQALMGSPTWVFSVDGDEIYDPQGLGRLRKELLSGTYQDMWSIRGHYLHCVDLDLKRMTAKGYLGPPSKEVTKIRNFSLVKTWRPDGRNTLFQSRDIVYRDESYIDPLRTESRGRAMVRPDKCYRVYKDFSWEDTYLRCLHLRFIKRSRVDDVDRDLFPRRNSSDWARGRPKDTRERFRVGPLVTKDVRSFFSLKRVAAL